MAKSKTKKAVAKKKPLNKIRGKKGAKGTRGTKGSKGSKGKKKKIIEEEVIEETSSDASEEALDDKEDEEEESPTPDTPPPTPKKNRFSGRGLPKKKEEKEKKGFFHRKSKDEKEEKEEEEAEQGFTLKIKEKKKKNALAEFFISLNYTGMGKFRHLFIQSLATMINAGLPLIDSLRAYGMEVHSRPMKKVVQQIIISVENGSTLWHAMEDSYFFTPYEIALVRIGEEAGSLARNLEYLEEQQEKDQALRGKVKMAMIYPSIVMVLMFIIVMGLGIFVLPNLVQVLYSLNAELPQTTLAVIYITEIFEAHGMVIAPSIIAGFIVIFLLTKYTRFKIVTQWFLFRIPGIGTLAREATIARFGVIMGGLLRAGVPLVDALDSLESVTQVAAYKKFYGKLLMHINLGDSFAKSFVAIKNTNKLLPISVQQLVITGERSGTLSNTLLKIADIYEKKAESTAEKLPIILEPMILLIIGGLVGTIAFAIITPIYSVVGNIGR